MPLGKKGLRVCRKGFSLLEILIGIAVLAILLMIFYQAGSRFVGQAHAQRCIVNLREYGIGFIQYSAQSDGQFPPYRRFTLQEDGTTLRGPFWSAVIREYIDGIDSGGVKYPFHCPTEEASTATQYGMNVGVSGAWVTKIQNPGQTLLVGETLGDARIAPANWEKEMVFRHDGQAYMLFVDGRVESRRWDRIPLPAAKSTPEYRTFWAGE